MGTKTKSIALETWERLHPTQHQATQRVWRVVRVTDSIEFHPGQELLKDDVEALTKNAGWKVTITALGA